MMRLLLLALFVGTPLFAQDNAGTSGAQVLQFLPGSRAAALSGAYTAISGDADALFYNPAGIASVRQAASLAYERYVADVAFGSLAAATRVSSFTVGLSVAFLNAGDVREVIGDPEFGGHTGTETGNILSASESALRLVAALPLLDGRLRAGGAIGFVSSSIAEQNQSAPLADIGAQYDVGDVTVGAMFRNLGPKLSGDGTDQLPTEARVGASTSLTRSNVGIVTGTIELLSRFGEGSVTVIGGIEAGMPATATRPLAILARVGLDAESNQLGALRAGASLGYRDIAFDYTYQNLEFFGSVHRFGLRLTRAR